jgi:glycosyltransferase involved in cell wall biosynthesis
MPSKPEISTDATHASLGVNISGYVNSEFGLGEGVRGTIRAIQAAGIPFVINNCNFNTMHRKLDCSYTDFSPDNPHPINIVQVNADVIHTFINSTSPDYFRGKYNIGYWAWELPEFPQQWLPAFNLFHEIWTPSNYCAEAIAPFSFLPVLKFMHSISLSQPSLPKQALELPENKFIFLFIFDFSSVFERKNPLAVIEAFQRAFGKKNQDVLLVIKFSNSRYYPKQLQQLKAAVADFQNIKLLENYLLKTEINALIFHCNCYVSLHRSEGFGLTMAEAMFYGKPVIATGYSANTEFMNVGNSFLVKYSLKELTKDYGCYQKGSVWAEPDTEHAASLMQYVFHNYQEALQIGAKAAQDVQSELNPQKIGAKIKKRLEYIMHNMHNASDIAQMKTELQSQKAEIYRLQTVMKQMENSKFWQLRNQWLKIKKNILPRKTF